MRKLGKGIIIKLLSLMLVFSVLSGGIYGGDNALAAPIDFSGAGTQNDPYLIETAQQLNKIRDAYLNQNFYFKQSNDIDLSSFTGTGWTPIGNMNGLFNGHFDGGGYQITGLMINGTNLHTGLFGAIGNGASIKNVNLYTVTIRGGSIAGSLVGSNFGGTIENSSSSGSVHVDNYAGGLVGRNYGTIINSFSSAEVIATNYVGGLASESSGTISNSYATGSVSGRFAGGLVGNQTGGQINGSFALGSVIGFDQLGGLVGFNRVGNITNSYAAGEVKGNNSVGGLIGTLDAGTVSNSYAAGKVIQKDFSVKLGGLVGATNSGVVTNSFYDTQTTSQSVSAGGVGKTTVEMQDQTTYNENNQTWDFANIWEMNPLYNNGYPNLRATQAFLAFDGNGHTSGTVPASYSHKPGVTANVYGPSIDFARLGHIFEGWNTQADGNGLSYNVGDQFTITTSTILFAKWFALSTVATMTSTIGTVSTGGTSDETISNIPYGTTLSELKTAISPAADATFEVYDEDGTTVATTLKTGKKVIVTAQDRLTKVTYSVQVVPSDEKEITAFSFAEETNASTINKTDHSVEIEVTHGTNLKSLVATYTLSEDASAKVNAVDQVSGTTANNFTNPVTYVVKAADGSTQNWTIKVKTALGSIATLTSRIGTVSTGGTANETITNIPYDTTLAAFKAAITPALDATFEVYDADGTTVATTLASGKKIIVTSQDGNTKITYTVTLNVAPHVPYEEEASPSIVKSSNGKLTLPAGKEGEVKFEETIVVSLPANATEKELILTIDKVKDSEKLLTDKDVLISTVYELLKSFPENFKKPVTITITFDASKLKSDEKAVVFYYDEVKKVWVEVADGKVSGNKITVSVDHFTKFAVFAIDQSPDVPEKEEPKPKPSNRLIDITGHWAETAIKQAVDKGIVTGYANGTFKPNHAVTRAEFTVMLMNTLQLKGAGTGVLAEEELTFTDASQIGTWAKSAVTQAVQAGYINGYADGTFRPDAVITRAEMAKMVANALGLTLDANVTTDFADDKDIPAWAKGAVAAVKKSGYLEGKGSNKFVPYGNTTRAEAVSIFVKMLEQQSK
ncbi:S-layer homology domain-containing protein [Paenibacillus sp. GSMTC-2017]|uniref:S-layer homology domain-containing protein n=1 Tax=Paenibacillus sp. GSMTC-2017 TaxID=2794350 RepID=UPI0018D8C0AD|nr:S-layer homology domain-containing protein [Paenibacillus sp. GSMTC-2017]MBH5317524.1 S-layer homology domain-containing protein [Paenibacillus sp. GSMTC-2017]